jgi:indolepyruvate ferredoxin oxidoreductase
MATKPRVSHNSREHNASGCRPTIQEGSLQMDIGLAGHEISLESRFLDLDQPVLLSGIQAIVRALLEQARLDRAADLRTAALVSGYRGSPLGGLDRELWRRQSLLEAHDIRFQPGLNEDLAATMLYGTQQIEAFPDPKYQGVFGLWYGKGPGVDRTGDAFHCGNMLGTSPHGGLLAVAGDDHGAHSSTYPHQTEQLFQSLMMPVLNPADVQDIIDFALAGWALSRYAGLWIVLKTTAETAEQAAAVRIAAERRFVQPDHLIPPHGYNVDHTLRFPADRAELERRVVTERLPAALAWARANGFDRVSWFYCRTSRRGDSREGTSRHHPRASHARPRRPSPARALQDRFKLAIGDGGNARFRAR